MHTQNLNIQIMIHQSGVSEYLKNEMPEADREIGYSAEDSVFVLMRKLVVYIYQNIADQNYRNVKLAFRLGDRLYKKGDRGVKNAVQNILVFSVTRMLLTFPSEKKAIIAAIPAGLFALYIAQVEHVGC